MNLFPKLNMFATPAESMSPHFPGQVMTAVQERVAVVEQVELAEQTYRIRLHCPDIATQILPGQFFMIRPTDGSDPLLGRPFALYDTYLDDHSKPIGIDFVYHTIGKLTGLMSGWRPGEPATLWGPLGNGFPPSTVEHLMCVGGGIGYTPFLAVARAALGNRRYGEQQSEAERSTKRVTLCYGARSKSHRADLSDFDNIDGFHAQIATDDGSEGHHGFVTDLVEQALTGDDRPGAVYCCGPVAMMHRVGKLCSEHDTPCWLSLETPMACGFGACFSCVTKVKCDEEPGWDYRRTCIEGPIFPAQELVLE